MNTSNIKKNYLVVISIRGVWNSRGVDWERKIRALAESLSLVSLFFVLQESLKNKICRTITSYCLEYILLWKNVCFES